MKKEILKKEKINMGIVVKETGGGNFELIPADNHLAMCYQVIDLGTHKRSFNGKDKFQRLIKIIFELPDLQKEFVAGEGLKPYSISREFTASLHKEASLRKILESWRGKVFSEDELKGFELSKLLGKPCLLQVVHSDDGKYANIMSIAKCPKSMVAPEKTVNECLEFSLDEFNQETFNKLPEYLRTKIQESNEWKNISGHPVEMSSGETPNEDIF